MDKIKITVGLDLEAINHAISQLSKIAKGISGSISAGPVTNTKLVDTTDPTFNPIYGDKNIKDVKETFTANKVGETKLLRSSLP